MKKYEKAKQRASFFPVITVNLKKNVKHFSIYNYFSKIGERSPIELNEL